MKLYRHGWGKFDPYNCKELADLLLSRKDMGGARPIDDVLSFPLCYLEPDELRKLVDHVLGGLLRTGSDAWLVDIQGLINKELSKRALKKLRGE